jgi:hypothetical protein
VSLATAAVRVDAAAPVRGSPALARLDAARDALDRATDELPSPVVAPDRPPPLPEAWSAGLWGSFA